MERRDFVIKAGTVLAVPTASNTNRIIAGDDRIISGVKNKVQVNMSNILPDNAVAHTLYEQQKPAEQEKQG